VDEKCGVNLDIKKKNSPNLGNIDLYMFGNPYNKP
jgi:hypothetical protein